MGGASNSDQTADTSGAQKASSTAPITMATMMMGGREEMVATPNGSTSSTPPTNDSYVIGQHTLYITGFHPVQGGHLHCFSHKRLTLKLQQCMHRIKLLLKIVA